MAFLTKKEQQIRNMINSDTALSVTDKTQLITELSYNASLRKDAYRAPVRDFLYALTNHLSDKIFTSLK